MQIILKKLSNIFILPELVPRAHLPQVARPRNKIRNALGDMMVMIVMLSLNNVTLTQNRLTITQ